MSKGSVIPPHPHSLFIPIPPPAPFFFFVPGSAFLLPPVLILPIVADLTSQMQPRQTAPPTVPDDSYNSQPACAHAHRTSFSKSTTSRNTIKKKISSKGDGKYT